MKTYDNQGPDRKTRWRSYTRTLEPEAEHQPDKIEQEAPPNADNNRRKISRCG